jgi:8-oxo-dGTP diphosphatase
MIMNQLIKVVAAIIENVQEEILCALRSPKMSNPNLWEFPGGKVEENENIFSALEREINEELKCRVKTNEVFHENFYDYDTYTIHLISIKCKIIIGVPTANEHSKLIWLKKENLESLKWAPADIPVALKLSQEK